MPEEKKLGPGVTYTNPDKDAKLVTVSGILLKEGEEVNLVDRLGEAKAKPILEKLSKNRYFKVAGGPEHKPPGDVVSASSGSEDTTSLAIREEARIRREQGDEAADKYIQGLDERGQSQGESGEPPAKGRAKQGEPPPDVQTPDQATLESPPRRRV